jgi:polyisoprenoid-binding protein YceI
MRWRLAPDSCVLVDLKATGLLRALAHSPTLVARPEPLEIAADGDRLDVEVVVRVPATSIDPPADMSASDQDKMRENLLGAQALEARRFPAVVFRGRYCGSVQGGSLAGRLEVRGIPHELVMPVAVARRENRLVATGAWEGRLTSLGVAPFKALLGAIRLEDWIRLRLEARLAPM